MKCDVPAFDDYPDTTPEVRAFAVSLWLGQVAGLGLQQQVPDDVGQLPDPEFVQQLLVTWFRRHLNKPGARAVRGGRFGAAHVLWLAAKRKLPPDSWQAFARWPCDLGTPWVRPHDDPAENARAAAARRRIAAGELSVVGLLHHAPAIERRERRLAAPAGEAAPPDGNA